jgi:phosphonate transport system substrate-binding protein
MALLKQYGFGIVASDGEAAVTRRALLTELCQTLSPSIGVMLLPYLAPTYRHLSAAVERGQAAFAWMPPLLVLELEDRGLAKPVVLPLRRGSTASFYSALITRHGGPRTIQELEGARAAWVERESIAGYLVARMHLVTQGFDPKKLGREMFVHSHDAVVDAVLSDRADVGATFCTLDPRSNRIVHGAWTGPDGKSAKPVDVLATAGPIPNEAIVASRTTPQEVVDATLAALSSLDQKRPREIVASLLRAEGFTKAAASHYAPLRSLVSAARAKGMM